MIVKNIKSAKESSLAPSFETELNLRAIYPSAISVNPIRMIKQEKIQSESNVSNNTKDNIILSMDMILGIDFFISIKSIYLLNLFCSTIEVK